jgi:hypothetical protein
VFSPAEIVEIVSGQNVVLSRQTPGEFAWKSPQIGFFFDVVSELPHASQALFIKFGTVSDKLPIGGLAKSRSRRNIPPQ